MLKNILNIEGAHKLTKNEQKSIKGNGPVQYFVCCPEDNNIAYSDCSIIECER
jgi:hypothetical protein